MSDESETPADTREGKRARYFKARIGDLLEELIEEMEAARKEGFLTNFQVGQTPEQAYMLGSLELIKKW